MFAALDLMSGDARRRWRILGAALLTISQSAACASSRYLGRTARDGAFVHRGFGLVVHPDPAGDWRIVREGDPTVAYALWPQRIDGPLDLNADGELVRDELTSYEEPTARLVSRTSTAVRVDVRVKIAGPETVDVPVERMLRARQASGDARQWRRTVSPGYEAWIGMCPDCAEPEDRLLALVDHDDFGAAAGRRRQIIELRFVAPRIDDADRARLDELLDRLYLARRADTLGSR
jgi:hypothetical protein